MATDFFERQSRAHQNTVWLVVLFSAAVIGIVGTVFLLTVAALGFRGEATEVPAENWFLAGMAALATLGVIVLGTLYKVVTLRSGGGRSVAESVGGRLVHANSSDFQQRRLLNVVEEMAIASGTPVPPVYLLEEPAINAFAAGYSPRDAVVGVTRGAMENLDREQLQGVIAHEFSHLLHGDMRINIRMIGILHGILLLSLLGRTLLSILQHSGSGSRRSGRDDGGGHIILVMIGAGLALLVIGFIGSFCGGLIKAAVSRQREYLADASAVQFTRNPGGIAGALKRIGAMTRNSRLRHPNAAVASHMYFAQGVYEGFTGLLATHPPLKKRILAIEPQWNGVFPAVDRRGATAAVSPTGERSRQLPRASFAAAAEDAEALVSEGQMQLAVDSIGDPQAAHRQLAAELLAAVDPVLIDAAHESCSARALVCALLLSSEPAIRTSQLESLSPPLEPPFAAEVQKLYGQTSRLDPRSRLLLIDLTLPALSAISPAQYRAFMTAFNRLVRADRRYSLFEWVLAQVLMRHLQPKFQPIQSPVTLYYSLNKLSAEVSVLVSVVARVSHDEGWSRRAFAAASQVLQPLPIELLPPEDCTLTALDASLQKLGRATAKLRGQLVEACAEAVCVDHHVHVREAELLRGIADLLDCPVPLLLPSPAESAA